jgi:hypothetical protein
MRVRGCFAALSVTVWAGSGCAAPTGPEEPPPEIVRQEPLALSVESLDVIHGALRIVATMADGSADVSVVLGGTCDHREVGGGVSTARTLVWALEERDVASAIDCGLTVHAWAREGGTRVDKVADLAVAVELTSSDSDTPGDGRPPPMPASLEVAQSVLHSRPLRLEGHFFEASLTVAGTQVESGSEPEQAQREEQRGEEPESEQDEESGQDAIEIE